MSDSEDQTDLIGSATRHFQQGKIELALGDFDRAIAIAPASAPAFHGRGLVHQQRNDLDAALADYDRALALDPRRADVYFKRSAVHRMRGAYDNAAADFDRAIQLLWQQRKKAGRPFMVQPKPEMPPSSEAQEMGFGRLGPVGTA